jgi:galactose mutarotase-like enzyme
MVILENKKIRISVSPEMGMALMDFTIYNRSILNQDLKDDFYRYRKGLGPIILPHFNQASPVAFKNIDLNDEKYKMFSHIKYLQEIGIFHPFQHGIGRYVSWNYQVNNNTIMGQISGNDKVDNITLKDLNGFDFCGKVIYRLFQNYLSIVLQISGEMPVASGIHFYYDSVDEKSTVSLNAYHKQNKIKTISLNKNHDDVLIPIADENGFFNGLLQTNRYKLLTKFIVKESPDKAFDSVVIFSNIDKRFVCIEPISYIVGTKNTTLRNCGEIQLMPDIST